MVDKLKVTDIIPKFGGTDGECIEQWIDKVDVACKLMKAENDIAKLLPLFLHGAAYATWKQLTEVEKEDIDVINRSLRRVFGKSKIAAWKELKQLKYFNGDSVDVLADQCERLLQIVSGEEKVPESLVCACLLDSLPPQVADSVRLQHGEKMERSGVVSAAKSLLISSDNDYGAVLVNRSQQFNTDKRYFSGSCFGCGNKGHRKGDCRSVCTNFSSRGHSVEFCRTKKSENCQVGASLE